MFTIYDAKLFNVVELASGDHRSPDPDYGDHRATTFKSVWPICCEQYE